MDRNFRGGGSFPVYPVASPCRSVGKETWNPSRLMIIRQDVVGETVYCSATGFHNLIDLLVGFPFSFFSPMT